MPRGLLASQRQPNVPNPPPPLYEDVILRIDREHWFANESPPAWAQYRDTLIKGTSWFDSIQGGVTLKKKKDIEKSTEKSTETSDEKRYVTGSFIGGFAPQSSYFDAEILITSLHGGGESALSDETIRRRKAIINTKQDCRLVGVVIGRDATPKLKDVESSTKSTAWQAGWMSGAIFPCPMPQNQDCWIAGFYKVTDIWHTRVPKIEKPEEAKKSKGSVATNKGKPAKGQPQQEDPDDMDIDESGTKSDWTKLTVLQLREACKKRGISGVSRMNKQALVNMLVENDLDSQQHTSNAADDPAGTDNNPDLASAANDDGIPGPSGSTRSSRQTQNTGQVKAVDSTEKGDTKAVTAPRLKSQDSNDDAASEPELEEDDKKQTGKVAGGKKSRPTPAPEPANEFSGPEWKEVITMYRLERYDLENKAWFAKDDDSHNPPPLTERNFGIQVPTEICQVCGESSPRIFNEHFLCHHVSCSNHWRVDGELCETDLTYTRQFLQKRRADTSTDPWRQPDSNVPPPIARDITELRQLYENLNPDELTADDFGKRLEFYKLGFRCPKCNMLNRRLRWHEWSCANTTCDYTFRSPPPHLTPKRLLELTPQDDQSTKSTKSKKPKVVDYTKLVSSQQRPVKDPFTRQYTHFDYDAYDYDLDHGCGITILVPQADTNAKPGHADDLYKTILRSANEGEMHLEKCFTAAAVSGIVTNHFLANYGAVYNLAVAIPKTSSWAESPGLDKARDLMNTWTRRYQLHKPDSTDLADGENDFNECYVAGYYSKMEMGWHDDGEEGLGSVVATWTLGGEGRMLVACNVPQYYGKSKKKGYLTEDYALPGCIHEKERKALRQTLEDVKQTYPDDTADHKKRRDDAEKVWSAQYKALMKNGKTPPSKGQPHMLLDIPLAHGSIAIMRGALMQKLYRHKVTVSTPLRIALTFRYIGTNHKNAPATKRAHTGVEYTPDDTYIRRFAKALWRRRAKRLGYTDEDIAKQVMTEHLVDDSKPKSAPKRKGKAKAKGKGKGKDNEEEEEDQDQNDGDVEMQEA